MRRELRGRSVLFIYSQVFLNADYRDEGRPQGTPFPGTKRARSLYTREFVGDERICRITALHRRGQLIYGNRETITLPESSCIMNDLLTGALMTAHTSKTWKIGVVITQNHA